MAVLLQRYDPRVAVPAHLGPANSKAVGKPLGSQCHELPAPAVLTLQATLVFKEAFSG